MKTDIIMAVVSSMIYSIIFYAKNRLGDDMEEFDVNKFVATVIVGIGVGLSFHFAGVDINGGNIMETLAMYTGVVAIVETLLKIVYRRLRRNM